MNEAVHGTAAVVYVEGEIPWGQPLNSVDPLSVATRTTSITYIYKHLASQITHMN